MSPALYSSKSRAPRSAILHLSPDLEPGDPGRETVDLAILSQRAAPWRALIASSGGSLVKEAERTAARHYRMPLNARGLLNDWRNRLQLEAVVQKEHPSLIHAHGIAVLPFAYALSRLHRMPLIADLTQPITEPARYAKLMANLKLAPAILRVPSHFMATHLRDTFKVEPEQMQIVPPGIDLQWYGAGFISPERLQTLSTMWRLPEQAVVVLVPMPLAPGFGQEVFLKALTLLRGENIFAVLAGSDRTAPGHRAEIEELVSHSGLAGMVIMPEACADLPAACWLASVVVAPNTAPRGQIPEILAAQAIGRPVIVTDTGANREMVSSGETAWVVPPDNAEALAEALRQAVRLETDQRLALAASTHDFIAENFPQANWLDGMLGLYDQMLHPSKRTQQSAAA